MELLKNIIIDFCLFSLIEGYIYCLFFKVFGNLKEFKNYEVFVLSIGNCLISQIFPPVIYQFFMILWMSIVLKIYHNNKFFNNIKNGFYGLIFTLITEMPFAMLYEYIFNIRFNLFNKYKMFLLIIPIRFIQIKIINNLKKVKE